MMNNDKFECNICFDDVKEPVVTVCGHLFCWNCILTWMNRDNYQCPVCQAAITRDNVIPLYGHGRENTDPRNKPTEPRPKPKRPTTSTPFSRQSNLFGGYSNRISISIGTFPFSLMLPMGFNAGSIGLLNMFTSQADTSQMTDGTFTNISTLTVVFRLRSVLPSALLFTSPSASLRSATGSPPEVQ